MSIRGEIIIECDRKRCHAEIVIKADEFNLLDVRFGVELDADASGWHMDGDSFICPQCANENPREKGDDDGVEYGDPRDYRAGLE